MGYGTADQTTEEIISRSGFPVKALSNPTDESRENRLRRSPVREDDKVGVVIFTISVK